jgi:hypothetical protein
MLHPDLARALAAAHIEDLHRAAARRHTIRLARRVAHEPHVAATPIAAISALDLERTYHRVSLRDRGDEADGALS